jgi:hypothetical protein
VARNAWHPKKEICIFQRSYWGSCPKSLYADFWSWLTIWLCSMCILFLSWTRYYGIWNPIKIEFETFKISRTLSRTLSRTDNHPFAYILPPTLTMTKTPCPAWIPEEMGEQTWVHITSSCKVSSLSNFCTMLTYCAYYIAGIVNMYCLE